MAKATTPKKSVALRSPRKVTKKKKKGAKKGAKKPVKSLPTGSPGFKLAEWCDSWVRCSGINTLDPILELGDNRRLLSLKIKQTCGDSGWTNRLRLQKLNVGIYDLDPSRQPIVIKDVLVSDTEELTTVDISCLPTDFRLGAIYINQDDHAYAKIRFDRDSINWFT